MPRPAVIFSVLMLFVFGNAVRGALVDQITPQVGQRGTAVEVTFAGTFIHDPQDVLFYRPGIKVKGFVQIETKIEPRSGKQSPAKAGTRWKATFEIAADCPLGEHPLRLRTAKAMGEVVSFYVTPFPVVNEANWYSKANDTIDGAQPIPLNSSVWGQLPPGPPQDHDFYKIRATKGQRISIEAVADRLGTHHYGGMNDPAIRLMDRDGRELARNDDSTLFITDPVLSIIAPYDGEFFIDMHQQMDYETIERFYILHVGTWSRPLLTYPLGGPAGQPLEVRVLGDPAGQRREVLQLPPLQDSSQRDVAIEGEVGSIARAASDAGYFEFFAATAGNPAPPSPNRLRVADFPNVLEGERNEGPIRRQAATLPVAFNGIIDTEDDADDFRFRATKGQRWFVRVYASALGSPLDPRIWIERADTGQRVGLQGSAGGGGGNQRLADDDASWEGLERYGHSYRHQIQDRLDPQVLFVVPEDGEYTIFLTDTRAQFGPMHAYRIEFHPCRDKMFTYLPPYPSQPRDTRDRFVVPRGTFFPRNISLQKGLGSSYDGPLQVEVIGLPPGVRMHAPRLYAGQTEFLAIFEADRDAPLQHCLFDIVLAPSNADGAIGSGGDGVDEDAPSLHNSSTPHSGATSTFKQTIVNTQRRGDYAMHFIFLEQAALAVVQRPPFRLELDQPSIAIAKNGELTLRVRCIREEGYEGAVYCEMDWLPPGITKQTPIIIQPGQSEAEYRLNATAGARPGVYQLAITGRQNEGGDLRSGAGLDYVASNFIGLTVDDPYVTVEIARAAIERTKQTQVLCQLKHNRPLPGRATATLKRLPTGVRVVPPLPTITANDTQLAFTIEANEDALLGQYKDIFCEVAIVEDGQEIRQQTGSGVLRIDPLRGSAGE